MRIVHTLAFLPAASVASLAMASQPPIFASPPPQTVIFGTNVTEGAPFSVQVTATSLTATDLLSLYVGTLPAGVNGVGVTGGGLSPATFTISGRVNYFPSGTTLTVPFTVDNGSGAISPGSFVLTLVPEPASAAFVAASALLTLRRRRSR